MDDFEEENNEKEGRGAKVLQTDRHTDPPTKRVLVEHSLLINVTFAFGRS